MNVEALRLGICMLGAAAALSACSGADGSSPLGGVPPAARHRSSSSPIQHVVVMIQENRTFNSFFATFPGADGTTTATVVADAKCKPPIKAGTISLTETSLALSYDPNHRYKAFSVGFDGGKMDAFDRIPKQSGKPECNQPYIYTNPSQIKPYWDLAQQYTLAEHMFATHGSSSFSAHQDLIRGSTQISSKYSLIDDPTTKVWGCDAKAGTQTYLITANDLIQSGGPFPCSNAFPYYGSYNYETLRDLLDAAGVSWKYYVPKLGTNFGNILNAFDVIAPVRYGSEWKTNVSMPQTNIFNDISSGSLPAVSWVIPSETDSDHPGKTPDNGPSWVASVVNAIGGSAYWNSTAIVILWDDSGGLYDNAPPPQYQFGELGLRVPALIVSPYAKAGYISTTQYEFASVLKYVEQNWNLGSLGTTEDKRANSIADCFNYAQSRIAFKPIRAPLSRAHFIHEQPDFKPPDTDF